MYTLSFSLTLEGVVRIHDAVLCLGKFSEVVSLEARRDKVRETPVYYLLDADTRTNPHFFPPAHPHCLEFFQVCLRVFFIGQDCLLPKVQFQCHTA